MVEYEGRQVVSHLRLLNCGADDFRSAGRSAVSDDAVLDARRDGDGIRNLHEFRELRGRLEDDERNVVLKRVPIERRMSDGLPDVDLYCVVAFRGSDDIEIFRKEVGREPFMFFFRFFLTTLRMVL